MTSPLSRWLTVSFTAFAATLCQAQSLTRSEALLSGFETPTEKTVWPDTIDLPPVWETAFRQMAQRTRETRREQGACLSVVSAQSSQAGFNARLPTLEKLRDLRERRASLGETAYQQQAAALRAELNRQLSTGTGLEFQIGSLQGGQAMSARIEENYSTCPDSTVGRVHTHPIDLPYPSDGDISNALSLPVSGGRLEAVVSENDRACVVIAGVTPFFSEQRKHRFSVWQSSQVSMAGFVWGEFMAGRKLSNESWLSVLGKLTQDNKRSAIFCGELGQPLKRLTVSPADMKNMDETSKGLILYAKAMLIAAHHFQPTAGWWRRMPFTPDINDEMAGHLQTAGVMDQKGMETLKKPEFETLYFSALLALHKALNSRESAAVSVLRVASIIPDGLNIPDQRAGVDVLKAFPELFVFGLIGHDENRFAVLFLCKNIAPPTEIPKLESCKRVAQFWPEAQRQPASLFSYVVDLNAMTGDFWASNGKRMSGQIKYAPEGGTPILHGAGEIEDKEFVHKGQYEEGKAVGVWLRTNKVTGAVEKVKWN